MDILRNKLLLIKLITFGTIYMTGVVLPTFPIVPCGKNNEKRGNVPQLGACQRCVSRVHRLFPWSENRKHAVFRCETTQTGKKCDVFICFEWIKWRWGVRVVQDLAECLASLMVFGSVQQYPLALPICPTSLSQRARMLPNAKNKPALCKLLFHSQCILIPGVGASSPWVWRTLWCNSDGSVSSLHTPYHQLLFETNWLKR